MKLIILLFTAICIPCMLCAETPPFSQVVSLLDDALTRQDGFKIVELVERILYSGDMNAASESETLALALIARIDPTFDFTNKPMINIAPPSGGGPSGVDPASIADPAQRAQYKAALEASHAYGARYLFQSTLCENVVLLIEHIDAVQAHTPKKVHTNAEAAAMIDAFTRRSAEKLPMAPSVNNALTGWLKVARSSRN